MALDLNTSTDLRELARELGLVVLREAKAIRKLRANAEARRRADDLERQLGEFKRSVWRDFATGDRPASDIARIPLIDNQDWVGGDAPLLARAVLRALCVHALSEWFAETSACSPLRRGDAFPLAERSVQDLYPASARPATTIDYDEPLSGTGFRLWEANDNDPVVVELDYTYRFDLDAGTWTAPDGDDGPRALARIATIHPHRGSEDLTSPETTAETFFGVWPKDFDLGAVLLQLERAADLGANAAVLPEMSLPTPDALADQLRAEPAKYPRLIVAGSAHEETHEPGGRVRSNISEIYLDGVVIHRHAKLRPFSWPDKTEEGERRERREDLAPRTTIRVLRGSATALCVAICSDLNQRRLPQLLIDAGVNLLLVPALTDKPGTFVTVAGDIAGYCQGVTVIVNGSPRSQAAERQPFMAIVGAPHEADATHTEPGRPDRCAVGLFDPNTADLSASFSWP